MAVVTKHGLTDLKQKNIREVHQLECTVCGASINTSAPAFRLTQFKELHATCYKGRRK